MQVTKQPYRDAQLERDLRDMDRSDASYSRVLKAKVSLEKARRTDPENLKTEIGRYYDAKLKGIRAGATCACCGFSPLVNIMRRGSKTVGPECYNHRIGTCKRGGA